MTISHQDPLPSLVIPSGESSSEAISREFYDDAVAVAIQAPAVLAETVNIEVSLDGTTYAILHDGTANIVTPTAGKARVYTELPLFKKFRLTCAAGTAAAARTFLIARVWTV
jgi:hypothetical protein